jgi:peptidoglycan/LPS O-acetylase OafA/YrhL
VGEESRPFRRNTAVPVVLDPFFTTDAEAMPFYQSWSLGIEEKFYLVCQRCVSLCHVPGWWRALS